MEICTLYNNLGLGNIFVLETWICLEDKMLHESGRNDTTYKSTEQTNEWFYIISLTDHEDDNQQSHTECCSKVCQRNELVLLEISREALVLCKRDNRRIIRKECKHSTQRRHTGKVEKWLHQWTENLFKHIDNSELDKNLANGTGDYADGHKVEHSVEQEVMSSVHDGIQHICRTHL